MNDRSKLETPPFGVGRRVVRKEDLKLLRGEGRYTDDVNLPGQAYAVMVRSRHAHGRIRRIDLSAARAMPGVLGIYEAQDLAYLGQAKGGRIPVLNRDGAPFRPPPRPALPADKVLFVGQVVACVVADAAVWAKDAAELVNVEIEPEMCVLDCAAAVAPGSPALHKGSPNNVAVDFHFGDTAAVDAAFARADHVVSQKLINSRVVVSALEPRAAIAQFESASGQWTLYTPSQGVFGMRSGLRDVLHTEKVRVITGSVGGSFGMKGQIYPEQLCILHAARALGRPVKWTDERSESFLSDNQGRASEFIAELALDRDGKFLAVRLTGYGDSGAYPIGPAGGTTNAVKNIVGVYSTEMVEVSTQVVCTNKTPVGAYRGAGRPEANYFMGRLVEIAARELAIDPVALRRRNLIPAAAIPYKTPTGLTYDSGDFPAVLDKALALADWDGFAARRERSAAAGRLRGRGLAPYLESTGPMSKEMGGIRFEPDGTVTMITGTLDYGTGHASPFAQILVDRLGVPFERVQLLQGDSDQLIAGGGSGGSKSLMSSGSALALACAEVIERGRAIAAHVLETAMSDIEFRNGFFSVVGTDRTIEIMELSQRVRAGLEIDGVVASLDVALATDTPPSTFPNGCHIAEVEVDPETGLVEVTKYSMVNDFGVVINPMIVEGQAHGGVMQGIGQALLERTVYSDQGQPLVGSFMDYALPRASDSPLEMRFELHSSPATTNPLGVKGCGEAGCAGALPSVMNAVVDALSIYGVRHIDMPATPEHVWRAIQGAARTRTQRGLNR